MLGIQIGAVGLLLVALMVSMLQRARYQAELEAELATESKWRVLRAKKAAQPPKAVLVKTEIAFDAATSPGRTGFAEAPRFTEKEKVKMETTRDRQVRTGGI